MTGWVVDETNKHTSRNIFFRRYEHDNDEYGFNPTSFKGVETFTRFFYEKWFQVQIAGLENIPTQGRAVFFGNHSGGLPVDGFLFYDGVINLHPQPRRIRFLVTKFLLNAPGIGKMLRGFGAIPPDYETATKLLQEDELVFLYKLEEFHGGFVRAALETKAPMNAVVTIGGDEIYPLLADCKPLAKLLHWPYFPLTPFFPWLPFPLCMIPLPVKIVAVAWPPFELKYPPEAAADANLVSAIVNDIRADIQAKVNDLLEIRKSPFSKWDMSQVNAYLRQTRTYWPRAEKHLKQP
jgi:1-acyl-sn-glycerol-3-phosphate acyltransferase